MGFYRRSHQASLNQNGSNRAALFHRNNIGIDLKAVLQREQARADRTGGLFSELVFDCHAMDDATVWRLWGIIGSRIRCSDATGWLPKSCIGIVLPDTTAEGAWKLAEDVAEEMGRPLAFFQCKVYVYGEKIKPRNGVAKASVIPAEVND